MDGAQSLSKANKELPADIALFTLNGTNNWILLPLLWMDQLKSSAPTLFHILVTSLSCFVCNVAILLVFWLDCCTCIFNCFTSYCKSFTILVNSSLDNVVSSSVSPAPFK